MLVIHQISKLDSESWSVYQSSIANPIETPTYYREDKKSRQYFDGDFLQFLIKVRRLFVAKI
jgi:hypothetical protein